MKESFDKTRNQAKQPRDEEGGRIKEKNK